MVGIGKGFAIVGGLLVGAVGAYNFSTTGCPLGGVCDDDTRASDVATTSNAAGAKDPSCPLCPDAGGATAASCNPADCDRSDCDPASCADAKKADCAGKADFDPASCPDAKKADCAGKADFDPASCPDAKKADCAGKADFDPANCPGAQAARAEADSASACCTEKAAQDKPAESDG